jgi:hypothetical protein
LEFLRQPPKQNLTFFSLLSFRNRFSVKPSLWNFGHRKSSAIQGTDQIKIEHILWLTVDLLWNLATESPEFDVNLRNYWEYFRTISSPAVPLGRDFRVQKMYCEVTNGSNFSDSARKKLIVMLDSIVCFCEWEAEVWSGKVITEILGFCQPWVNSRLHSEGKHQRKRFLLCRNGISWRKCSASLSCQSLTFSNTTQTSAIQNENTPYVLVSVKQSSLLIESTVRE